MANVLKLKRSAVPSKAPQVADLDLGELAINTYDGKLYTKKDNGTASIVEIGGGTGGGGTSTPYEQSFTATASQTNFTLTNTPAAAWVWVNGAIQDASEWSISGNDIVLATASTSGDAVEVYYLSAVTTGDLATKADLAGSTSQSFSVSNLAFPATQVASADANTLDDYEEGTWTPTLYGTTTAGTPTYAVASGTYVKIGSTVFIALRVKLSSLGGMAGNIRVGGLPFSSNGSKAMQSDRVAGVSITDTAMFHFITSHTQTYMTTYGIDITTMGANALSDSDITSSFDIYCTSSYPTTS